MSRAFNRREFLGAGLSAAVCTTFPGCASSPRTTPAEEPAGTDVFTVTDTHAHFYDPTRPEGVPWPPRDEKRLYRKVLPTDYRALPVPQPVTGTIVVEASPRVEDNQWVLDLAAQEPFILGLVGNLPIGTPQFAGHFKRFAADKLFRGIRIRDRKLDGTLDDPAFVSDLKLLLDHDRSLDLVGNLEILAYADRLAGMLPNLRIIIDHLAGVTVDGKSPPADWQEQMKRLARRRNVYCKLSGLVEGTGRNDGTAPRDVEFYRPVLDTMWHLFGAERLIYASNWPVSELYAPLSTVQGIVGDYLRNRDRRARAHVFSLSGKEAYRWAKRHGLAQKRSRL